jgi:hypothetical protein
VEDSDATKIYTKRSDEAVVEEINIEAPLHNRDRFRSLQGYRLTQIPAPGLREIKQVEMYSKFRKFVPVEFRDEICPRPSQQVLENIKKARSEKAKARSEKAKANDRRRGRG